MLLPNFRNSNEAIEYAKHSSPEEVKNLHKMLEKYLRLFKCCYSTDNYLLNIYNTKIKLFEEAINYIKNNKTERI